MNNEFILRSIKIVDIIYLGVLYFTIAIIVSVLLNKCMGKFNPRNADNKSSLRLICEIYLNLGIIAIIAYILRNIIEVIPFPLDGINGYSHSRVKELAGGVVFGYALFYYQKNLREKIQYVIDRFIEQN